VMLLGPPRILPGAEMARVLEKFKSYGRAAVPGPRKRGK
jgi:hypothetical protein